MSRYIDADKLIESIEWCDWYHINPKGKLTEGAESRDSALYKANDIYERIERLAEIQQNTPAYCDICDCDDCPRYADDCDGKGDTDD